MFGTNRAKEYISIATDTAKINIECKGVWKINTIAVIQTAFDRYINKIDKSVVFDCKNMNDFDSSGMLLLIDFRQRVLDKGYSVDIINLSQKQQMMIELLQKSYKKEPLPKPKGGILERIGENTLKSIETSKRLFSFLGEMAIASFRVLAKPTLFRLPETVYHIEKSGLNAIFIIAITSMLVGLVIAYQSIVQLAKFGADIYVIDTIGIAITRELGPLITAIVIAGRSASSYTAEIGTMKLTEEISAMRIMGFDPMNMLVIPRVVALVVVMPLLIFFSDIMGIAGGMFATKLQTGISYDFFIQRLNEVMDSTQYILGIIKGPFFAVIIAITGCFRGFLVTEDTESIGIETTASVVYAIFFVIACDGLFSVIYTEFNL